MGSYAAESSECRKSRDPSTIRNDRQRFVSSKSHAGFQRQVFMTKI